MYKLYDNALVTETQSYSLKKMQFLDLYYLLFRKRIEKKDLSIKENKILVVQVCRT